MALAVFMRLRATGCLRFAHAEFLQDDLQRTKARERRLEKIEPDKGRKPKPVRAVQMGEQEARENEGAGEHSDAAFECHKVVEGDLFSENFC
jgi:hypothetical protein